jgi:hypothetical protein
MNTLKVSLSIMILLGLGSIAHADTTIKGYCSIAIGGTNLEPKPCASMLLILKDSDGKEVDRERTSSEGRFEFTATEGKDYKIVADSHFYEVVWPRKAVHAGDSVGVQVVQN